MRRTLIPLAGLATLAWALAWGSTADWAAHLRVYQVSFFGLAMLQAWAALRGDLRGTRPWHWALLLGVALAARAVLACHPPTFSNDAYRYLWDAHIWRAGINPFRYAPSDPHLAGLREGAIYPHLNHPQIPTIYPLGGQLLFALASFLSGGMLGWKLVLCVVELLGLLLLGRWLERTGRPLRWLLLAAWHPLALAETATNAHLDAAGAAALLLCVALPPGRGAARGLWLGLASLIKWNVTALVPVLRPGWRGGLWMGLVLAAGALAFTWGGVDPFVGTREYLVRWRWNDSLFWVLMQVTHDLGSAKLAAAVLYLGWLAVVAVWVRDPIPAMRAALAGLLLLSPVLHPWYLVWALPLWAMGPGAGWTWLLAAAPLAYGPAAHQLAQSQSELTASWRALEFLPAGLLWIASRWWATRKTPGAPWGHTGS